jgi:hypothetical protein
VNGRERCEAVLRGEPFDHLPRLPILMQFAAEHMGSNYGAFAAGCEIPAGTPPANLLALCEPVPWRR